mmetsp:Transcript_76286/g.235539  ORF Transcript_76286/g.235539 Transcript_76286/m.235539 type:complete len:247 (+) Transcript_76286:1419-2159(+)
MSKAPWLSFLKSTSGTTAVAFACACRAAKTAPCELISTWLRAVLRAACCLRHLDSKEPMRTFIFTSVLRASEKGPLVLFLTSSKWPFRLIWPFSMSSSRVWMSFSDLSRAATGSSRSAPQFCARASAASVTLSASSWSLSRTCVAASTIFLAARLSTASCRRRFSPSMLSWYCLWASPTFFFSSCCECCTFVTRGFSLDNSALVSAKGPVLTPRSSSTFCSRYFMVWLMAWTTSCSARWTRLSQAA